MPSTKYLGLIALWLIAGACGWQAGAHLVVVP